MAESDAAGKKCAILLSAIGEELAASVLRNMLPREVQRIGVNLAVLGATSPAELHSAVDELRMSVIGKISLSSSSDEFLRNVLNKALGEERAATLLDRILAGTDQTGIESLKWMDSASIAELIKQEHPQVIAVVLSHLEYDQSADVLKLLPDRLRNDVIYRIATLEGVQPGAMRELNEALARLLSGADRVFKSSLGGVKTAAEILNLMSNLEAPMLESLREVDFDLAQAVQDEMFVFENLLDLDDRSIQAVLRQVQSESLILALKGSSEGLREKIFRNMSSRAAEMLREDLETRGPVRLSQVEEQQKEILKVVRALVDDGTIILAGKGDEGLVA